MTADSHRPDWVVLGLGNPGEEYAGTRHNVGVEVVDALAQRHAIALARRLPNVLYGTGAIAGHTTVLAKPRTYMNLAGLAAKEAVRQWHISPSRLLVVIDDVALPVGTIRIRKRGSDGGHKGLRSVLTALGTVDVPRLRIGIGHPGRRDVVDYVLSPFSAQEWPTVQAAIERAAEATEAIIGEGIDRAMNRFNTSARS